MYQQKRSRLIQIQSNLSYKIVTIIKEWSEKMNKKEKKYYFYSIDLQGFNFICFLLIDLLSLAPATKNPL